MNEPIDTVEEPNEENSLIFTRYLYSKLEVKQSLMLALIDNNTKEALFWAYELYFSGFEEELYDFIFLLYENLYKVENPTLLKFIKKTYEDWLQHPKHDWLVGSIIYTLSTRTYQICSFMDSYLGVKCKPTIPIISKRKLIINLKKTDIVPYKTIKNGTIPAYNILKTVCKYQIRKNINTIFKTLSPDNLCDYYTHNWLFYASRSPIWEKRILKYDGIIDNIKKQIIFEHEELEEEFYNIWNYEPDEQPLSIRKINIGDGSEPQISILEFCNKYSAGLITIKIKRKLITKSNM